MAAIYEMIRRGRRHMAMAAKTAVHDVDILIASGVVDRVECAYSFGHELGLTPASTMYRHHLSIIPTVFMNTGPAACSAHLLIVPC